MCPVILSGKDGSLTAIGACGGRKIFPAVFQLASLIADFNLSAEAAAHHPRIDVSGTDQITIMDNMDTAVINAIRRKYKNVMVTPNGVSPNLFALPQIIKLERSGMAEGACFIPSPHAKVVTAD